MATEDCSKQIESALVDSEERFRQMAEMTGEWLWEQDPDGFYLYSSNAVKQILGFKPEQVIGKHYTTFLTAQDQQTQQFYATSQQPFYGLINHYQHKNGHEVLTESTGLPIIDAQGKLLKWRGVDRDITAREAAEQQIRAAQVNLAIAQNEIKIAQQIQATLSPSAPLRFGVFEVAGFCLPADKVGGDYFDYFFRTETQLELVIADVSGHSIGPALFMVETRSVLRAQTNLSATPAVTLGVLNDFLFNDLDQSDYFISLFYMQVDVDKRQASFANAGHPPPLLLNGQQRTFTELDADGLILGVKKAVVFEEKTAALALGDVILFYTDGLIEAENDQQEFFGLERVKAVILQYAEAPPQGIIDALFAALRQFCQRTTFEDDITLMVFKYGKSMTQ